MHIWGKLRIKYFKSKQKIIDLLQKCLMVIKDRLPIQLWKTTVPDIKHNKETSVRNSSHLEHALLGAVQRTRPPRKVLHQTLFSVTVCNPR